MMPTSHHETLDEILDQVVARVGDPAPLVYERLFGRMPELRALFVNDATGSVRGEMFCRAVDTLRDLAADQPYADGMVASERVNHACQGVDTEQFNTFFVVMGEVFREALGEAWSPAMDEAWRGSVARVRAVPVPGGR